MTLLPDGNWDLATFDADVDTTFEDPPWTVSPEPPGSITSPGVFEFDDSQFTSEGVDGVAVTLAMGFKDSTPGSVPLFAVQVFVGPYYYYLSTTAAGIYTTYDEVTLTPLHSVALNDTMHELYSVWDSVEEEVTVYLDGALIGVLADGSGLFNGFGFEFMQISTSIGLDLEFYYAGVSSEEIIPDAGAGPTGESTFTVGATGLTFTLDELAHYSDLLTDEQIMIHYKAGRGLPV